MEFFSLLIFRYLAFASGSILEKRSVHLLYGYHYSTIIDLGFFPVKERKLITALLKSSDGSKEGVGMDGGRGGGYMYFNSSNETKT